LRGYSNNSLSGYSDNSSRGYSDNSQKATLTMFQEVTLTMVQVVTLTMVREATLTIVKLWFNAACVVVLRCFWSYRGARSTSSSRSPACNSYCEVAICVFCRKASMASVTVLLGRLDRSHMAGT
jgi:hypothetical protein